MVPDRVTTDEYVQDSVLILTVSDITYLFVDILRASTNHNATLQVTIAKLPATAMEFTIDHVYNDTVSEYEVKSTKLLVKAITPSEMKKSANGFGFIVSMIAVISVAAVITRKRKM